MPCIIYFSPNCEYVVETAYYADGEDAYGMRKFLGPPVGKWVEVEEKRLARHKINTEAKQLDETDKDRKARLRREKLEARNKTDGSDAAADLSSGSTSAVAAPPSQAAPPPTTAPASSAAATSSNGGKAPPKATEKDFTAGTTAGAPKKAAAKKKAGGGGKKKK